MEHTGRGGRGSRQMRGRGGGRGRSNFPKIENNNPSKIPYPNVELTNPLSSLQKNYFSSLFPNDSFKLSYETVAPKKVSLPEYDLCLAIPFGKKAYIWFTYHHSTSIALLFELNRENQIGDHIHMISISKDIPIDFELGTIISGTIYEKEIEGDLDNLIDADRYFLLDDIHMYKGISVSKFVFREKTGFIRDFFLNISNVSFINISVQLPFLWNNITEEQPDSIPYNIRHIQYRSTSKILPHLNVTTNRKPVWSPVIIADSTIYMKDYKFNYSKPIYRKNAFFYVKADIAYDVYYLGALDKSGSIIFFQHSLVMNYKTSILLNGIFRNIRENRCLDYIEESDDESDFENVREDKYVDLEKRVLMECAFHSKFKKWMPIQVASDLEKPLCLDILL